MPVTDDEVLQAMTRLGLGAHNLTAFRTVRYYLRHELPLCCIGMQLNIFLPLEAHLPDLDKADRLIERRPEGSYGHHLGWVASNLADYLCWAFEEAGRPLHYHPCPACVLAGNFVDIPEGCPCCADKDDNPDPGESDVHRSEPL